MPSIARRILFTVSLSFFACDVGDDDGARPADMSEAVDALNGQFCGGIAAFPCPEGYECIDDPTDDCDPERGGADCGGVCVRSRGPCTHGAPGKTYVAESAEVCATIRFVCSAESVPFADHCGCGCWTRPDACRDPSLQYVSTDPAECARIRFFCAEGTPFSNECGCGCDLR